MSERTTFREVAAEIMRRITTGPWGPGTLLPGEVELAEEFGCSRTTVNRAMREVTDLGLVERRRKSGTRVRLSPLREVRFEMPQVRAEIERAGGRYRYALIERQALLMPEWLRSRMGLPLAAQAVHVICVHHASGEPFQMENRWINAAALPEALDQDFTTVSPSEWLIATVPFSQVEASFQATRAGLLEVTHLGFEIGEPVFVAERNTWWQDAPITHVRLSYRRGYRMTSKY